MKLCLALNGIGRDARHPDYLLDVLSASQYDDWRAFNRLYPFGQDQIHLMIARLTAYFYNVNRPKGAAPANFDEFIPKTDTAGIWERIEAEIEEQRRLAAMTPAERTAEAKERLKREHAARMKAIERRKDRKQRKAESTLKRREAMKARSLRRKATAKPRFTKPRTTRRKG